MANQWEIIDERELDRAEALIWEGRYDEARQLLTRLHNAPARQLLAQLPQAELPEAKGKGKSEFTERNANLRQINRSLRVIYIIILVVLFMCSVLLSVSKMSSGRYQATARSLSNRKSGFAADQLHGKCELRELLRAELRL
ncbi:MAG: hypothetical protein U0694_19280 [Anaerolineae bacterium]